MLKIVICAVLGVVIAEILKVDWLLGLLLGGGIGVLTSRRG
jgi:hypothetical protein